MRKTLKDKHNETSDERETLSSLGQGFLPQPRLCSQLCGQEEAEQTFLHAWQQDRLAHAWLLFGLRGVGKATFAYRMARALLSMKNAVSSTDIATASTPSSAVFQQVAAGTHPDFMAIASENEKEITVDRARALVRFLQKTPIVSRYRVSIVDAADQLNREAANALLKLVEEPGRRVVLFLVCHATEALLPTLRSRCRALLFRSVAQDKITSFLLSRGAEPSVAQMIATLSCGSFYYAGLLAEAGGEAFLKSFAETLSKHLTKNSTDKKFSNNKVASLSEMLHEKAFANERPEAFRFLWQRFLACAVRADKNLQAGRTGEQATEEMLENEALLGLLSAEARDKISLAGADFWQGLWQRSVPHLLASRSARGGDFALSADYALEGLREAC